MAINALYLHLPFCRARCAYCDFETRAYGPAALERAAAGYVDALIGRLEAFAQTGALEEVRTVYIGGGTPTAAGAHLVRLVEAVRRRCAPKEFSCEANPESFTEEMAAALERAGVTRVSIGVQSLDDAELESVGRIHTAAQALAALERARAHGFATSCDLICGLPGQTEASWEATLRAAVAAGPGHVSVYPLMLEEGTPLARRVAAGELEVPDDDFQADAMLFARALLVAAGYAPYEVASYAMPGSACRHNIAYWTGVEYLGLGRSAASMLAVETYRTLAPLFGEGGEAPIFEGGSRVRLAQRDDAASRFERECLSAREAAAEDLMLACRMTRGVPVALLARAAAVIPPDQLARCCGRAVELGLARWVDSTGTPLAGDKSAGRAPGSGTAWPPGSCALAPTEAGWLRGNELYELFWCLAEDPDIQ